MRRIGVRVSIAVGKLVVAVLGGYIGALVLESRCPPPTPENSTPGCEGLSFLYGGLIGFVGTLVLIWTADGVWKRVRQSRSGRGS